ncbi:hypothetical protein EB118_04890 [bacterium]|nr:hypothetical protein [bacterium]NDC94174.1 hypothetical protein [bacterium]NDD82772.1 hypothetical protein [bacterium]NDG29423.1 hypothetical protein [bacterium]
MKIDGVRYDPYYILDVTVDDSDETIQNAYRKKVRKYHPDKAKDSEQRKKYTMYFKIIVESYEYIKKKRSVYAKAPPTVNMISTSECRVDIPQEVPRPKEQEELDPVVKQFDDMDFNVDEFNRVFDYTKRGTKTEHGQLIHKTTDGFYGYNSGNVGQLAMVHSYNGLMISGEYVQGEYVESKWGTNSAKNPEKKVTIPQDYTLNDTVQKIPVKTKFEEYTRSRRLPVKPCNGGSNLYERTYNSLVEQQLTDKEIILKHKSKFDKETVNQALEGMLEMSPTLMSHLKTHYLLQ